MHHSSGDRDAEDIFSLSALERAELQSNYDLTEGAETEGPLSFDEPPPSVLKPTELGSKIVAVGRKLLDKPVREDAGTNADKDGLIRSFFIEGIPWKASYWDDWVKNHPQSPVARPEWCAAFACYCVRTGYAQAGLSSKLPKVLSASTSALREQFIKLGRFIHRDELFDAEGKIRPDAKLPSPGDIVLWQGHTGLLSDLTSDGTYYTLEGNTKPKREVVPGVYLLPNSSTRKIERDGKLVYSLTGFCQLVSVDG